MTNQYAGLSTNKMFYSMVDGVNSRVCIETFTKTDSGLEINKCGNMYLTKYEPLKRFINSKRIVKNVVKHIPSVTLFA